MNQASNPSSSSGCVTRFAPSPTGSLHIGSARTALFNFLYARHVGGKFLLRIEDTDRARSTQQSHDAIIDGLNWLGILHDGDIVIQSSRGERHAQVAKALIETGKAYYDDGAIRLKAPLDGSTVINDLVQGKVEVANSEIDDMVILRSDGTATYMLAVVVDDHDMGVTHVIRGDDHLTNAFRQIQIYKALDWPVPAHAHIPLIHGQDGTKLSKRKGALGVQAYKEMGYLPEALCNYLLRLGWGHGNDEIISQSQAIEWFDVVNVQSAPARLNQDKLLHLNAHYIKNASEDDLGKRLAEFVTTEDVSLSRKLIAHCKSRSKTLLDLAKWHDRAFAAVLEVDEPAAQLLQSTDLTLSRAFAASLEDVQTWELGALQVHLTQFLIAHDVKLSAIAPQLRAALLGTVDAPGVAAILEFLGRERSLERLKRALCFTLRTSQGF